MSDILSFRERRARLLQAARNLESAIAELGAIEQKQHNMVAEMAENQTIRTYVEGDLALLNAQIDDIGDELVELAALTKYHYPVLIGKVPGFTALNINATAGTITAVGGNPFNGLTSGYLGYKIRLENCENPENNGEYALHSSTNPTSTVLTLAAAISGGVDNTEDTKAQVRLVETN